MIGYKVTMKMKSGYREYSFNGGSFKYIEDAKKYCEWLGEANEPRIIKIERPVLKNYFAFDADSWCRLKEIED